MVTLQVLKGRLAKTENVELSLKEALCMAEENNPLLHAAEANVRASKAAYQTKLAQMLPDLKLSYQEFHLAGASNLLATDLPIGRTNYIPQMVFRFPVFRGGRQFFQMRAAHKTYEAEQANTENTRQETLRQTALLYYDLKRSLEQIAISRKTVEELQIQLEMNQARMDAGVGTRLEVLQAEAQLARARQDLLEASKNAELAAVRLNEVLDLSAFVSVLPAESGQQMLTLVPDDLPVPEIMDTAHKNRQDLQALLKQIASLREMRKVAWSAYLPEVFVQARQGAFGTSLNDLRGFGVNSYGVEFNLTNLGVPALTLYKQNTAQIAALEHQLEAQLNTMEREIAEAVLTAMTQKSKVSVARTELVASEQSLSDSLERLNAGVGRYLDVLNAQTSLTRARSGLSATILEYNQSQVNLIHAMGLASIESLTQGIQQP